MHPANFGIFQAITYPFDPWKDFLRGENRYTRRAISERNLNNNLYDFLIENDYLL